ncbi:MAG: response regulator transcription factor [Dehalococcoidia bacterium]
MRIAIAEPDPSLADLLAFVARRRGHQPVCVSNVTRLFERLPFEPAAAIVSFPEADDRSAEAIASLRKAFPGLIVLATVERAREPGPQRLLNAGARDVIRIPYNPNEVILRAETLYQAAAAEMPRDDVLRVADIEVDLSAYAAKKNGVPLPLTKLELRLLYCLAEHSPNVAPIERLLAFAWESEEPDPALLKTHVSHLRKKLREAGGAPVAITSRQMIGYVLSQAA